MKKSIFVYFSYSGDNDKLANLLQKKINCETLKLVPEKEYTNSSIKILFQGGNESLKKKCPNLKAYDFNPDNYDLIIIGTPVWAWTLSPVLRSFLANNSFDKKTVAITCTHRGSAGKTIENIENELRGNEIILKEEIHAPIEDNQKVNEIINKLYEYLQN